MSSIKTRTRYVIVGGDYSQQEPRLLTHMCGDDKLKETYNNKKDLYATIGAFVFHKDYWECMEHWQDGSPNDSGKVLRARCKQLVLGIMYGMGAKLMAKNIKVSVEECKEILDEFFKMFPTIKEFTLNNEKCAKEKGYVEDYMGRRRHLPDAQLPQIVLSAKKQVLVNSQIFFDDVPNSIFVEDLEMTRQWENMLAEILAKNNFKLKESFKEKAKAANIDIKDNGAFISKAMTQCTNARIQGSASSLTKKAMVEIFNDDILNKLGFRLLIPVHDELLGECPIVNAAEVEKRLAEVMIAAGKPECSTDMKCDTYCVKTWYTDELENSLHEKYKSLINGNPKKNIPPISPEEAFNNIKSKHSELSDEILLAMCNGEFDHLNILV